MRTNGFTIADMSMRTWVLQPGTLITHWGTVKYAALSVHGISAPIVTFVSLCYTTAADVLVSPKLKFTSGRIATLFGLIIHRFEGLLFYRYNCETPMPDETQSSTFGHFHCTQFSFSRRVFPSYDTYLSNWAQAVATGGTGTSMRDRPLPVGTWYSNTTVTGSWVEIHDMAAMPHAGVFTAAHSPANNIRHPEDFSGQGEFEIRAAALSPVINVICACVTKSELAPLVHSEWPNSEPKVADGWMGVTGTDFWN
ncbi:hypothetical protein FQN57_002995 [Myotisia sp. PD_48]|nr:hypothetical protein FQN57_002995 [Myotisia sp. PD_48]